MDFGTFGGMGLGMLCVVVAIILSGSLLDFVDLPSILIVFGTTGASLFIMFPAKKVLGVFSVVKKCFTVKMPAPQEEIRRLSDLAAVARRDGLLALEKKLSEVTDPFLIRGLEMVIDGTPRDKLEEVLSIELGCIQERHATGKKIFDQLGALFPAFGMVGTLIGLIQMLGKLDDPSKIGAGMAVAMITTFYGSVAANLVCLPLANKLEARSKEETLIRELMINGLVALVEGEPPRAMETKLKAFLSPKARKLEEAA